MKNDSRSSRKSRVTRPAADGATQTGLGVRKRLRKNHPGTIGWTSPLTLGELINFLTVLKVGTFARGGIAEDLIPNTTLQNCDNVRDRVVRRQKSIRMGYRMDIQEGPKMG
ncbi:hypothetical protein NPIL_57361 [Nephila pilipes]|uniref:Uncharacterized protein n=1 Tax=Nephila pilipes TaxID=299642 RepID=A0A8X6QF27_NEPPI|nr:hypothetical protein NPIL_57361 [Nephila pilipes]